MKVIFIVGTGHQAYQIRPQEGPLDGAEAFRLHILQTVRTCACKTIAEEMSIEGLNGRRTVGHEVADEEDLNHIFCDPTSSERKTLGISVAKTRLNIAKRENEWLRRLLCSDYPILFLCGALHVRSFAQLCRDQGWETTVVTGSFEAPEIPLDRRII